jgi:hypothetical protein
MGKAGDQNNSKKRNKATDKSKALGHIPIEILVFLENGRYCKAFFEAHSGRSLTV